MKRFVPVFFCAVLLLTTGGVASAACSTGGGGGQGMGGASRGSAGASRGCGSGGIRQTGGACSSGKKVSAPQKPALPAAETVADFKGGLLKEIEGLGLSKEQAKKVEEVEKKIAEFRKELEEEQASARKAYGEAKDQEAINAATQRVLQAMQAIRNFRPMDTFKVAVGNVLNSGQYKLVQEKLRS